MILFGAFGPICNGCKADFGEQVDSTDGIFSTTARVELREKAAGDGWGVVDGGDFCPTCLPRALAAAERARQAKVARAARRRAARAGAKGGAA